MKRKTQLKSVAISLIASALLVGCGGSSDSGSDNEDNTEGEGSNIPYLKENHANYSEHGSTETPAPTKDASAKSINWTIAATTEEGAEQLAGHITFMDARLKEDKNPRSFDKLFLMEAYMKFNSFYTTSVERSGTNVVVSKNATTVCAYEVISSHSDAVSGDFFARGDTSNDYSAIAEGILANSACDSVRSDLTAYIAERQKQRG